ncbi:MAG: AAA-like domain-containing protein [Rivularia sp. (in: cyanobacteria)]
MNSPQHPTPNTQPPSTFYQVGASLPIDAPSYVQRQADEEFYQKLQAGKFCYVLNSRQMGKSSLRVQTMQRLQKQGTICAAIDLTGIGNVNQQQWYGGIVYNLSESCQLEDKFDFDWQEWWQKHQTVLSPVQCLDLFIEKVLLAKIQQPIVIFVDEIDKVLSQDFSADDFFGLIRFFQNQRVDNPIFQRLTFALLGVATPGDLIQNKTQTPFNIGEAIELHGFKFDEVEPLIEGLQEKCDRPRKVMAEILDWTGGQPFLTQKLCKFMVEESEKDNSRSVKEVVKSRIIENWESQDNPEHLRTIRDRILSSEQRAGYLLELYQQIQQHEEVAAKKNVEYSELRLSGLVVQREGKLRVYNRVYQRVFNKSWVENQLKNLRPYSENFRFWVASGGKDESRLLRGLALESAEEWAKDKNLSFQDKQFLAASREKEIQEKIAVEQKEAQLERERKDKEAEKTRNEELAEANRKAKRRISIGSFVLGLTLLGAVISITIAGEKVLKAQNELKKAYTYVANPIQLKELVEKLPPDSEEAIQMSKKAAIKIKEPLLEQAYLHASKSLAHQYLEDWESAETSIEHSINFLFGWKENQSEIANNKSNHEFLQLKIFALTVQGNVFKQQKNIQKARTAYQEALNLIQENRINPLKSGLSILDDNTVESLHYQLIELITLDNSENSQENNQLINEISNSLIQHFYDGLEYFLQKQNWKQANLKTLQLMVFITKVKKSYLVYPQIEQFPCNHLKKIDDLWVQNSKGHFGFSAQKEIWLQIGNRLSIKPPEAKESYHQSNYERFTKKVGWHWYTYHSKSGGSFIDVEGYQVPVLRNYQSFIANIGSIDFINPNVRGGLPYLESKKDKDCSTGGYHPSCGGWYGYWSDMPLQSFLMGRANFCKL